MFEYLPVLRNSERRDKGAMQAEGQHHAKVLHPQAARVGAVTEAALHELPGRDRIAVAFKLPAKEPRTLKCP
jgi:hypothetical protein